MKPPPSNLQNLTIKLLWASKIVCQHTQYSSKGPNRRHFPFHRKNVAQTSDTRPNYFTDFWSTVTLAAAHPTPTYRHPNTSQYINKVCPTTRKKKIY